MGVAPVDDASIVGNDASNGSESTADEVSATDAAGGEGGGRIKTVFSQAARRRCPRRMSARAACEKGAPSSCATVARVYPARQRDRATTRPRACLGVIRCVRTARQENMPAMEEHCEQRERALSAVREGNGDTVCVEMELEPPRGDALRAPLRPIAHAHGRVVAAGLHCLGPGGLPSSPSHATTSPQLRQHSRARGQPRHCCAPPNRGRIGSESRFHSLMRQRSRHPRPAARRALAVGGHGETRQQHGPAFHHTPATPEDRPSHRMVATCGMPR
eukprot:1652580-Prymnesium_polylepis.1